MVPSSVGLVLVLGLVLGLGLGLGLGIELHAVLVEELVGGRVDEDVEDDVQEPREREHRRDETHAEEEDVLERVAAALLVRHLDLLPVALQEVDRLHELVVLPLPLTAGGPVALGTDGLARVGVRVKGLGWG